MSCIRSTFPSPAPVAPTAGCRRQLGLRDCHQLPDRSLYRATVTMNADPTLNSATNSARKSSRYGSWSPGPRSRIRTPRTCPQTSPALTRRPPCSIATNRERRSFHHAHQARQAGVHPRVHPRRDAGLHGRARDHHALCRPDDRQHRHQHQPQRQAPGRRQPGPPRIRPHGRRFRPHAAPHGRRLRICQAMGLDPPPRARATRCSFTARRPRYYDATLFTGTTQTPFKSSVALIGYACAGTTGTTTALPAYSLLRLSKGLTWDATLGACHLRQLHSARRACSSLPRPRQGSIPLAASSMAGNPSLSRRHRFPAGLYPGSNQHHRDQPV